MVADRLLVLVSQAWGVEKWTVAPSAVSDETRLKMWTSQEIQESTNVVAAHHNLTRDVGISVV